MADQQKPVHEVKAAPVSPVTDDQGQTALRRKPKSAAYVDKALVSDRSRRDYGTKG